MQRNAFTLIELMIVVAILAVLAVILVPNFIRARAQSQLVACESNERDLDQAFEMYATDNSGNYPPANGTAPPLTSLHNWSAYVSTNPVCPTNRSGYIYSVNSTFDAFSLTQGPSSAAPHSIVGVPANYPQYWSDRGLLP